MTAKYLTRHYISFYTYTLKLQCSRNFNDFHTETKDLDTLSEWVKSIRCILKSRIKRLKGQMKTIYPSSLNKAELRKELDRLYDQYVLVPADKTSNNPVFVCKAHYINY